MVKLLVIVTLCIVGASMVKGGFNKEEAIKEFMERTDACVTEIGAAPSDVDEMMKEKPASTKEGKCLRACVMKKCHVMTDDGKFSREGALEKAKFFTDEDPEKMKVAEEIIDQCVGMAVSDDHCEAAEEYGHCFKDQLQQRGITMQ